MNMDVADLPTLNAGRNTMSAIFLTWGYRRIRQGDVTGHQRFMLAALAFSALFLTSYLFPASGNYALAGMDMATSREPGAASRIMCSQAWYKVPIRRLASLIASRSRWVLPLINRR